MTQRQRKQPWLGCQISKMSGKAKREQLIRDSNMALYEESRGMTINFFM